MTILDVIISLNEVLHLNAGAIFKMADEIVDLEPESKRPRISLESTETKLGTNKDNSKATETTQDLSGCVLGQKSGEKVKQSTNLSGADQHVQNNEEIKEISGKGENEPVSTSSDAKPGFFTSASVSEKDVGILEFVSNLPGFHGVLKQRYTDFIVSERDLEGNLVRLTDESIPQEEKSKEVEFDILSSEEKEKIQQVVDDEEKKKSVTLSPDDDKEHRRLIHRAIRANFPFLGKTFICFIVRLKCNT